MATDLMAFTACRGFMSRLAACAAAAGFLFASHALSKDQAEITFVGYQSLPGARGRIFVELSELVAVEVSRSGRVIEYKMVGASVPLRNNRNPLLLGDFGSSALSAVLVPDKQAKGRRAAKAKGQSPQPSVRLVIALRGQASPTFRMLARGNGAALEVELPPPSGS
jgi:hypothetical protein